MMHIARGEYSPTTVIWIFYALEAIYDTRVGESFTNLTSRIALLLGATPEQANRLRKNLRELYDFRNSFVHGGLEVIHPARNEQLDRDLDHRFTRVMSSCDFGFRILLCSVQEIAKRGWIEPVFSEVLSGKAIGD